MQMPTSFDASLKAKLVKPKPLPEPPRCLTVGENLSLIRAAVGMNQTELAEMIGMTQSGVCKLETRHDLKVSKMQAYLGALGVKATLSVTMPDGTVVEIPFVL